MIHWKRYIRLAKSWRVVLAVCTGTFMSSCAQLPDSSTSMVPALEKSKDAGKLNAEIEYVDISLSSGAASYFHSGLLESQKQYDLQQWKKSLIKTLKDSKKFLHDSPNRFILSVTIMDMHPIFRFDFGAEYVVAARYQIKDAKTEHIVYSRDINTKGTIPSGIYFMPRSDLMHKALVMSVNSNIKEFVESIDVWNCPCWNSYRSIPPAR